MNRLSLVSITLIISIAFHQCSKSDEATLIVDVTAPVVSNLSLDDITNNSDARDLEVTFSKVNDETLILEYRIIIVKSSQQFTFKLSNAESLATGNYLVVSKDGTNKKLTLPSTSVDSDGDLIIESVTYIALVMSVSDGSNATINSLSKASNAIALEQTSIKITYIGNDGVYISDGVKSVIIDALPGNLSGWNQIANNIQNNIENGSGDFMGVKVAMVTHNHGDHVSFTSVNSFLGNNKSAIFIAPPDITPSINNSAQVSLANPALGQFEDVVFDGIKIRVMHIKHFNAFGNNFSTVINYAYLIEIGGLKILHLGDCEYSSSNFAPFNLNSKGIDVVLIPALSPFLTSTDKSVIDGLNSKKVITLHLLSSTSKSAVNAIYPEAEVFSKSLEFVRY